MTGGGPWGADTARREAEAEAVRVNPDGGESVFAYTPDELMPQPSALTHRFARALEEQGPTTVDVARLRLIWSHEHGAWWGPRERGYTAELELAGRYSKADAERIVGKACLAWVHGRGTPGLDADIPPEVAVPDTDSPLVALEMIQSVTQETRRLRALLWQTGAFFDGLGTPEEG